MLKTKRFLLLVALVCSFAAQAERREVQIIKADVARNFKVGDLNINRLVGDVALYHNATLMTCDSAYLYPDQRFEAFGHLVINKDTTWLYGDYMDYRAALDVGKVRGKIVTLLDGKTRLRTQILDFNTSENAAYFRDGGVIDNEDNLLESKEGVYYSSQKLAIFSQEVEMKNEEYRIKSDSLHYYSEQEKALFFKQTYLWGDSLFLSCRYGYYERKNNHVFLQQEAYLQRPDQELWSDSAHYYRTLGVGYFYSNIQVLDTAQRAFVFGDYAKMTEQPQKVFVTDQPSAALYGENVEDDTLFLRADTLLIYSLPRVFDTVPVLLDSLQDSLSFAADSAEILLDSLLCALDSLEAIESWQDSLLCADTVEFLLDTLPLALDTAIILPDTVEFLSDSLFLASDTAEFLSDTVLLVADSAIILPDSLLCALDSLEAIESWQDSLLCADTVPKVLPDSVLRYFLAYHNVRFYHPDVQGKCDSFIYMVHDSLGEMHYDPIIWNAEHQLSAERIDIRQKNNQIHQVELVEAAFVTAMDDSVKLFFNQIKGVNILAHFADNELYRIDVYSDGQTVYYMRDKGKISGVNKGTSTDIVIFVKNRKVQKIEYIDKSESNIIPPKEIKTEELKLKGFSWQSGIRPQSRWEISQRLIVPSFREESSKIALPLFPIYERVVEQKNKRTFQYPADAGLAGVALQ